MVVPEKFNLQDRFLNQVRVNKIEVKVYLVNGFQMKGIVKSFDSYTVLIESGDQQSLVYKHAISTIIPSKPVRLMVKPKEGDGEDKRNGES